MLEKLKENKKMIIIALVVIGAALAWWQSKDAEEKPAEPTVQENIK
tara:strand:- start:266 stop:403 length:138 start_codon:yes stop_codon:yes gene_type:complete